MNADATSQSFSAEKAHAAYTILDGCLKGFRSDRGQPKEINARVRLLVASLVPLCQRYGVDYDPLIALEQFPFEPDEALIHAAAKVIRKLQFEAQADSPARQAARDAQADDEPALDEIDFKILREIAKHRHALKVADLSTAQGLPSDTTCKARVKKLIAGGYAHRASPRGGAAITPKGRALLS